MRFMPHNLLEAPLFLTPAPMQQWKDAALNAAHEASAAAAFVLGAHMQRLVSRDKYLEAVEPSLERLLDTAVDAAAEQQTGDPLAFLCEFFGAVLSTRSALPPLDPKSPIPKSPNTRERS